jgi:hypothetical protein
MLVPVLRDLSGLFFDLAFDLVLDLALDPVFGSSSAIVFRRRTITILQNIRIICKFCLNRRSAVRAGPGHE